MWDTAGQQKNRTFTRIFFNDTRVALIILDATQK